MTVDRANIRRRVSWGTGATGAPVVNPQNMVTGRWRFLRVRRPKGLDLNTKVCIELNILHATPAGP
jgi:hypothetical protein